jgi:hypothetical protein
VSDLPHSDPWRARIHSAAEEILGAGIVLAERHVLTCAHVVPADASPDADGAGWPMFVDVINAAGRQRRAARVAREGWVPLRPNDDHAAEGDLAVLELDEPLAEVPPAPLHRSSLRPGSAVRACGYPSGSDAGTWARGELLGAVGELQEITPRNRSTIRRGYSGAGVVDEHGRVIGLLVSAQISADNPAYMMPVDTILGYLPALDHDVTVTGVRRTDPALRRGGEVGAQSWAEVLRIYEFLAARGNLLLLVIGDHGSRRADVIGLLATVADPASREIVLRGINPDTDLRAVPPAGSIDMAFSVAGMSTSTIAAQIAERLGLAASEPAELLDQLRTAKIATTVVLDAVDDAAEPETLLNNLLVPLAELASGGRVVAGLREQPSSDVTGATLVRLPADQPVSVPMRLDRLDELIDELRVLEADAARVARGFANTALPAPRGDKLRMRVALLRAQPESARTLDYLAETEHSTDRALRRAGEVLAKQAERRRLGGRLDAFQAMAAAHGHAEDDLLARLFDLAYAAVHRHPCDLTVARGAVRDYLHAVWRALDLDPLDEPPNDDQEGP